jgi:hypothetical protein
MVTTHPLMQKLYATVAADHAFILEALKPMAEHDEYLTMLLETLEMNRGRTDSPILMVTRSDFMIHETVHETPSNDIPAPTHQVSAANPSTEPIRIGEIDFQPQQVEFNTISTGLIGISQRIQQLTPTFSKPQSSHSTQF